MATFKDRIAEETDRRSCLLWGVEMALAPLLEFLDEIRDQPDHALVDVSLDRNCVPRCRGPAVEFAGRLHDGAPSRAGGCLELATGTGAGQKRTRANP